jgi:hypothetical protein
MMQFRSTYCSDPRATHYVEGIHPELGGGILGYFTDELTAHRAAREYRNSGGDRIRVVAYDPKNFGVEGGMHHLVAEVICQ